MNTWCIWQASVIWLPATAAGESLNGLYSIQAFPLLSSSQLLEVCHSCWRTGSATFLSPDLNSFSSMSPYLQPYIHVLYLLIWGSKSHVHDSLCCFCLSGRYSFAPGTSMGRHILSAFLAEKSSLKVSSMIVSTGVAPRSTGYYMYWVYSQ